MLIAAVAVSVGMAPIAVPSEVAFSNSVVQFADGEGVEEVVFTQAARMSAMVLIWAWGTTLGVTVEPIVMLPVVVYAVPVAKLTRFEALAKALAIPTCAI